MGGVMARQHIYDAFMNGPDHAIELFHGYTYSGHPIAAAAGVATLETYKKRPVRARPQARGQMGRRRHVAQGQAARR